MNHFLKSMLMLWLDKLPQALSLKTLMEPYTDHLPKSWFALLFLDHFQYKWFRSHCWIRLILIRDKYLTDLHMIPFLFFRIFGNTEQIELDSLELIYANVTTGPIVAIEKLMEKNN